MASRQPTANRLTYADYCLLPDDGKRYQVIEGELIVSPAPRTLHQRIVLQLAVMLELHAREHHLGEVYVSPIDVILAPATVVQPDILFVQRENQGIVAELNIQGAPDLCVEVLSPGSELVDRERKKTIYARFGVQEYWIVDPTRESVIIYELDDGIYTLRAEATGDTMIASRVLTGFETSARAIFP